MWLKVSASSLISAAPRTSARSWNSARLMARVDSTRPRIGRVMPTANRYPKKSATNVTPTTKLRACAVQFVHAGVDARVVQAALRDDGPAQLRNGAVGADHFDFAARVLVVHREIRGLRGAQVLRQFLELLDEREHRGDVASRHELSRVRIGHDATMDVNDEDGAIAHARVAQPLLQPVERDDRREHSGELAVLQQRHGHHQRRMVVWPKREGFAEGIKPLNARR